MSERQSCYKTIKASELPALQEEANGEPYLPPLEYDGVDSIDMDIGLVPGLWNIVVKPYKTSRYSKGGIYMPDQVSEANDYFCAVGEVVAMGSLCFTGSKFEGLNGEKPVKIGDFVTFNSHSGIWIKVRRGGTIDKYKVIHDDQYLTTVNDPERVIGYVK